MYRLASQQEFEAEFYFRYDGYEHAQLFKYPVIRRTNKGCWIQVGYQNEKFILNNARRRWAYPTQPLALQSFQIRKHRQIMHCNNTIELANVALQKVGLEPVNPKSKFAKYNDEYY